MRGVFWMAARSLRHHAMSTCVTASAVALGAGLLMAVFSIQQQSYNAFTGGPAGFDAVLGARGSQLQLVLNTVFHLETSPGNLPWPVYQAMRRDPRVALAVPYAVGDNFYGFRVVGTTEEMFTKFEYRKDRRFEFFPGGRIFDPARHEAVIGFAVAEKTGLAVGSAFQPYHGLAVDEGQRHQETYDVVGVLQPTNSPSDRVIWIPIEGVFRLDGHVLRGAGETYTPVEGHEIPDEHKEVSAVMLKLRGPMAGFSLDQSINRQGKTATLAWPIGRVMSDLFDKIGWVNRILQLVAYLIVLVAAASISASVYNTINERRREFAILRALGARRRTVFSVIVIESTSIAALGSALAYGVYAVILFGAAHVIRNQTGVQIEVFQFHPSLALTPPGMCALGAIAGIVPAVKAYATDVAEHLTPNT